MTIRITFSLVLALILMSVTYTHAENTPGASIENAKKIREARPSFIQLVDQVKEIKRSLLELEIAITEANTARLVERNEDFQKTIEAQNENFQKTIEAQNENFQKTLELMEKIGQIKSDLETYYNSLNNPLNQLRNEFDNRGGQLFQWRRDLDDAEARVTKVESQIQEDRMSTAQQIEGLTSRLDALGARVQNISAEYVQKAEFELREQKLLTRILHLEEENQSLLQRFQVSETLIQRLGQQIITNSDRLALVTEGALTHLSRIEQIEADIIRFESFSDRLDALAAKDIELDREVFAINDISFRLEELATGLYSLQAELLRLEGETKNIDDIYRLNSEDLNVVLRRLDELEIVQPTLADQYSLRNRMSEILYQQSLIAEDSDRLKILEDKILMMEEQLASPRIAPDVEGGMSTTEDSTPSSE
jgi:septation ring formation regulator EzrA